jgi:hypothetical protein
LCISISVVDEYELFEKLMSKFEIVFYHGFFGIEEMFDERNGVP